MRFRFERRVCYSNWFGIELEVSFFWKAGRVLGFGVIFSYRVGRFFRSGRSRFVVRFD